jgi:hypothetical protein
MTPDSHLPVAAVLDYFGLAGITPMPLEERGHRWRIGHFTTPASRHRNHSP